MDLDSILDDALNDFDDADEPEQVKETLESTQHTRPETATSASRKNITSTASLPETETATDEVPDLLDSILDDALKDFDQEVEDERIVSKDNTVPDGKTPDDFQFGDDLEKTLEQMAAHLMKETSDKDGELGSNPTLDASIDQAVKMISEGAKNMSDDPQLAEMFGQMEGMEGMEDFFKEIMGSLDGMNDGQGGSVDSMVENMFSTMLQKEHFEQPMRDIADRYPGWLKENESKCSAEEFANYNKQYKCFQKILDCYKSEPADTKKIMEYMKEMQEYGQPPEEIVSEMMPNMGGDPSNMLPQDMEKCKTM